MKSELKNILLVLGGVAVGGVIGFFTAKAYYQKKYQEESDRQIAEMENYYGLTDTYKRDSEIPVEAPKTAIEGNLDEHNRVINIQSVEERREAKAKLKKANEFPYNEVYQGVNDRIGDGPAAYENPPEDEPEMEEEDEETEAEYLRREAEEDRAKSDQPPELIDEDEINGWPVYSFSYNPIEETFMDERDNQIDSMSEILDLFGDTLDGGKLDEVGAVYYVRNWEHHYVYEVSVMGP